MLLGFNRPPGFTDEDIHDMFCGDPELCEDTDIDPSLLEAIRGINQCGWIYTFACCSSHPNEHPKAQWGCDEYDRSSSPYIGMYVEDHRAEELRGLIKLENDKTTKPLKGAMPLEKFGPSYQKSLGGQRFSGTAGSRHALENFALSGNCKLI